eukprot:g8430.t1
MEPTSNEASRVRISSDSKLKAKITSEAQYCLKVIYALQSASFTISQKVWINDASKDQGGEFKTFALMDELCLTEAYFVSWPEEGVTWDEKLYDMLSKGPRVAAPTRRRLR